MANDPNTNRNDESLIGRFRAWMSATFPGKEKVVLGGLAGALIAILIFIVGIWRALLIALFVVIGVAVGQYLDGDPKILRAVHKFITDWRR